MKTTRRNFIKTGSLFVPVLLLPRKAGAIIGVPPYTAPAVTYLIKQGFEGTGYDNSEAWTPGGAGTVDPDYTGVVLDGAQSFRVVCSSNQAYSQSPNFAAQTEAWGYFMIRPITMSGSGCYPFVLNHAASQVMLTIAMISTGALRIGTNDEAETATTADVLSAATTYHVFWHYKTGTGANGIGSVGFSTDATRPTSGTKYAEITTGSNTQDVDNIVIGSGNGVNRTLEHVMDKVRVNNVLIDSNPS